MIQSFRNKTIGSRNNVVCLVGFNSLSFVFLFRHSSSQRNNYKIQNQRRKYTNDELQHYTKDEHTGRGRVANDLHNKNKTHFASTFIYIYFRRDFEFCVTIVIAKIYFILRNYIYRKINATRIWNRLFIFFSSKNKISIKGRTGKYRTYFSTWHVLAVIIRETKKERREAKMEETHRIKTLTVIQNKKTKSI